MKNTICIAILLIIFSPLLSYAERDDISYPDEMLYNGRPIDPTCVYGAIYHSRKDNAVDLKVSCNEIYSLVGNDVGGFVTQEVLAFSPRIGLGYDYDLGEGMGTKGYFYYKYLGQISQGLVIHAQYSGGGTGHFSNLSVYQRKGDTLKLVKTVTFGDRCDGSAQDAVVINGILEYDYYVTEYELYERYKPGYLVDGGTAPIHCGAELHIKDNVVQYVKFESSFKLPPCAKGKITNNEVAGTTMSDDEAREFINKVSEACDWKPE